MQSLISKDTYWGEFDEDKMDHLLFLYKTEKFEEGREYIDKALKRTDFIFGKARSDFLYAVSLNKESVCLDIGCGLGVHTFNMAPLVKEVHSCDLSKKRVQFCEYRKTESKQENVFLYHSDIGHLNFKENTFDFIVMNGVVEWLGEQHIYLDPRMDQIETLKKVRSLLKPGGVLYIGIENRYALTYLHNAKDHNRLKYTTFMPRFLADWVTRQKLGKPYRTYTYSKWGYEKLLQDAGFNISLAKFYVAHPGYNMPQYLIDVDDIGSFKFFFSMILSGKRFLSHFRWIYENTVFIKIARYFFYSYAIFAKK